MPELNKKIPENQIQADHIELRDNAPFEEMTAQSEFTAVQDENNQPKEQEETVERPKNKKSFLASLSTSLVVVVAAAVVGITNLLNVNLNATFNDELTKYVDGKIQYSIDVTDLTEKESLKLYLYEDQELIETFALVDEENDGIIDGEIEVDKEKIQTKLDQADNVRVEYRLDLKGEVGLNVERAFDSYVFQIDKFYSTIDSVDMHCECSVDGCYHFLINFTDPLEKFTEFEAWIEDENGNVATCEFSDDLHAEQKIFVGNMTTSRCKLFIRYLENGEEAFIMFSNNQENEQKDNFKIINL